MKALPDSRDALVVRTDFSDDAAWEQVCREIEAPVGEFRAYVSPLSDREYAGCGVAELTSLAQRGPYRSFLLVVDRITLTDPEHPVLVLDLDDEAGRTFRVIPRELWGVENNLSLANMDFSEFADSVNADGVFRGFPEA